MHMQKSLQVLRLSFGEQPDCDRTSMMVSSEPLAEQPLAELQSGMQDRLAVWNARLTIGQFVFDRNARSRLCGNTDVLFFPGIEEVTAVSFYLASRKHDY